MTAEPDVTMNDFFFRSGALILIGIIIGLLIAQAGCAYTRNAPLLNTTINANGNTVPVHAVP